MKRIVALLAIWSSVAVAQPTPSQPGLTKVAHDQSLTGNGTTTVPAGVRVKSGGGLNAGAATGGLSLETDCSVGQVLVWDGSGWICGDGGADAIVGTLGHIPYFTPDGSHLGDTPATYDPSTVAGSSPLTAIGTVAVPVHVFSAGGGEPAGNPTYTTTGSEAFGRRSSASTNVITLATAADADNFPAGATVFASPNADATSPRAGSTTVVSSDTNAGTVTLTSAAAITGFANNDYLFVSGVLTGAYSWRYVEYDPDPTLHTGMSPASATITLSSQQALVTFGQVRRGMTERVACRTKAGGSTYYAVHNFSGGFQFFDTVWIDNIPDSSLTLLCPTTDTTRVYAERISNDGVRFLRTHPAHVGAADVTELTSDPLLSTYARDSYGPNVARTINGTNFSAFKTGRSGGGVFAAYTTGSGRDTSTGYDPSGYTSKIFFIGDNGTVQISPAYTLTDAGVGPTVDRRLITAAGTLPAVTTELAVGVNIAVTGNGSSPFEQDAMSISLAAGYGGSARTNGLSVVNNTAGSGIVGGLYGNANGAGSGSNVGVAGVASGATWDVGVYAGFSVPPGGRTSAFVADNGSTGNDLIQTYNNGTQILRQLGDGTMIVASQVYLDGSSLSSNYTVNGASTTNINYTGYLGGATQFRNLSIYDGKNALAATITASSKLFDSYGSIKVDNAATWSAGTGAPAISCAVGDTFSRTDGGVGTIFYTCTATNTWTALSSTSGTVTGTGTANTTTKWSGTSSLTNAWPLDDATTWGVASKFIITEGSGNFHGYGTGIVDGTLTADGGVRVFDVAGNGLTSTLNRIDVSLAGASCAAGTFVTTISSIGTGTCSAGTLIEANTVSVTGVSGTQNDYAPSGIATADILDITTSGSTTITGFSASQVTGQRLTIRNNASSTNQISVSHGAGSSSANQLTLGGLANWIISVGGSMTFTYNGSKWHQESFAGTAMPAIVTTGLASIGGTLAVTGAATLSSSLTVTLGGQFNSTLNANGNVTSGANVGAASGSWHYWGDGTDYITATNSGTMSFVTTSATRGSVTGAGVWKFGVGADAPSTASTNIIVTNAGTTGFAVRDSTNDVEAFVTAASTGASMGSTTNHSLILKTNNTDAITISTAQAVTFAGAVTATAGTVTLGSTTTNSLTVSGANKFRYSGPSEDSGTQYTVSACGTGSSQVTQGGATSGTVTIGPTGTGCVIAFGSGVGFAHAATVILSQRGGTKTGYVSASTTGGFTISGAVAADVYDFVCTSTP